MGAHLGRALYPNLKKLQIDHGEVDTIALSTPFVGAAGYNLGRYLDDEGITPEYRDGFWGDAVGRSISFGEMATGFTLGLGAARTLEKAKCN